MTTLTPGLALQFHVVDPDVVGSLAVFPLIADASPSVDYISFAAAIERGATVKELAGDASVNDLIVSNPLDVHVLLYEGEEVLGAQQNRTLDVSVLVAAGSELRVPVSCVEEGRWDSRRHADAFTPAPQAAYPEMRRMKNRQVRAGLAAGGQARAVQGEVWAAVVGKASRHGVSSPTGALHDVFEERRRALDAFSREVTPRAAQVGALAAIGGRFVVLDHVSDAGAWSALHGPIVQGYALDALEVEATAPPALDDAREFVARLLRAPTTPARTAGLGEGARFEHGGLAGTALSCAGELVALTAFTDDDRGHPIARRVRRPSQRR